MLIKCKLIGEDLSDLVRVSVFTIFKPFNWPKIQNHFSYLN